MHWNHDEIEKNYYRLLKLYHKEKKPLYRNVLWNDLCSLNNMLSLYDENWDFDDKLIEDEEPEDVSYLKSSYNDIIVALNEYMQIRISNRKPSNVKIDNYNELLLDFLYKYHSQIVPVYYQLTSNNKIELNPKKDFSVGYNGECIYNVTLNEIYLYARYNGGIFSSVYLPHELGHAYQADCFDDISGIASKRLSIFIETYSTYIELLFMHYLKELGYQDQARYLEKRYWNQFNNFIEQQMMYILNWDHFLRGTNFKYIISMLLSNIFYEDYLKTGNHQMINEFNEMFLKNNDTTILKEYQLKRILDSGSNAFKRIL